MKRILSAVCCIVICSVPALAQKKKAAGGPAMTDQKFVDFAAQTDMVEANLGQMAGNVASSQAVKDYAQSLVTDHNSDFSQLYSIAHQANLTMPSSIDTENNKTMIAPFEKLKGAAFDHRYVADMVAGHTKAIAIYKREAADAENPALKSYAEQALPTLEKHLDSAKDLQKAKPEKKG
jgi:putative membrane protein